MKHIKTFIYLIPFLSLFNCSYEYSIVSNIDSSINGPYHKITIIAYSDDNWDSYINKFINFIKDDSSIIDGSLNIKKYMNDKNNINKALPEISFENTDLLLLLIPVSGTFSGYDIIKVDINVIDYIPSNKQPIYKARIKGSSDVKDKMSLGKLNYDGAIKQLIKEFITKLKADKLIM